MLPAAHGLVEEVTRTAAASERAATEQGKRSKVMRLKRRCWEMCRIDLPGERRSRWFIHGAYVSSREPALPEQCRSNEGETKSGGAFEHCVCVSVHH